MGLELRQGLKVELKQALPSSGNVMLRLSPLELELLFDGKIELRKQDFHSYGESHGRPIVWNQNFFDACKTVRDKVERKTYLERPQIFVEKSEVGYSAVYNSEFDEGLRKKVSEYNKRSHEENKINLQKFVKQRRWTIEQQLKIVKYLCEKQDKYLQSNNPFDMGEINQENVATYLEYSVSSISSLVRNLTMQLQGGRSLYVEDLMPSNRLTQIRGVYVLRQLQQDHNFYENGEWKFSDFRLLPVLKQRFGLEVKRRTLTKYKALL